MIVHSTNHLSLGCSGWCVHVCILISQGANPDDVETLKAKLESKTKEAEDLGNAYFTVRAHLSVDVFELQRLYACHRQQESCIHNTFPNVQATHIAASDRSLTPKV